MLFDHGCDSLITGLFIISWMKFIGTGLNFSGFMILIGGLNAFFLATLETYYVGGLFLPIVNVPSDGNFLLSFAALPGVFAGSNVWFDWDLPFYPGITWRTFWVVLCPTLGTACSILNLKTVSGLTTNTDFMKKLFAAVLINVSFISAFFFPGKLEFLEQNYIWFLYLYLLCFGRLSKALMVNHSTEENYHMFQWPVVIVCSIVNVYTVLVNTMGDSLSQTGVNCFWTSLFVVAVLYYAVYVAGILKHLSKALGINILTVKDHPMPRIWNSLFFFPLGKKFL